MTEPTERSIKEQGAGEITGILLNGEGLRRLSPERRAALGEIATSFGLDVTFLRQNMLSEDAASAALPSSFGSEVAVYVSGGPPGPETNQLSLAELTITTTAHSAILEFDDAVRRQQQVRESLGGIPGISSSIDVIIKHGKLGVEQPFQNDPERRRQQEILDAPITEAMPGLLEGTENLAGLIERRGFATLADVLVAGSERFIDNPGLGAVAIDKVQRALRAINPNDQRLNIKSVPTMAEILEVCPTLDRLPAFLIDNTWNYGGRRLVDVVTVPREQLLEFVGRPEAHEQVLQKARGIVFEYLIEHEKIKRGAPGNHLTDEQPAHTDPSVTKEQKYFDLLNTRVVDEVAKFAEGNMKARVQHCLEAEGITTLSDVLVAGKLRIIDIPKLGIKGVGVVNAIMTSHDLSGEWKDRPTIADYTRYCRSLAELPAFIVPSPAHQIRYEDLSVEEVLEMSVDELAMRAYDHADRTHSDQEMASIIKREAQKIADDFLRAQEAKKQQG